MAIPSPIAILFRRAAAWLKRNPNARAEALELAAVSLRDRAAGPVPAKRAARMLRRANLYALRARQLRARAGVGKP